MILLTVSHNATWGKILTKKAFYFDIPHEIAAPRTDYSYITGSNYRFPGRWSCDA